MIVVIIAVAATVGATMAYILLTRQENEKGKHCPLDMYNHWQAFKSDNGETHVVPFYDDMTHMISDTCLCVPTTEYKESTSGWVITHRNVKEREAHA